MEANASADVVAKVKGSARGERAAALLRYFKEVSSTGKKLRESTANAGSQGRAGEA